VPRRRARGSRNKFAVKLDYQWHERKRATRLNSTIVVQGSRSGQLGKRTRHLPTQHELDPGTSDKPKPRPRREHFTVEAVTMGTPMSLTGQDLRAEVRYQWRGMSNPQALRLALRIKDDIPADTFFAYRDYTEDEEEIKRQLAGEMPRSAYMRRKYAS
jgi:hypothetical protein